ncbi:MAG: hypothetical protein JNM31_14930 [Flavobacteriales bacterium]|nr:hypothetical protein [Flavobacteriales bacterium]
MRRSLLIGGLLCASALQAQDNQYWTQQHGARAALMGGAAVANMDDQAVLFYNPAAVRRVKSAGITTSANYFYMQWLKAQDLSGLGLKVTSDNVDVAPRLLVGSFDPWGAEGTRISIGYVSNLYGRFEIQQAGTVRRDLDTLSPGDELVTALVNSYTTTREDIMGLGFSKAVGEQGSLGITLFGSSFSQRYLRTVDLGLYGDPAVFDTVPTLRGFISTERGNVFNLGFQTKMGYFHTGSRSNWGISVTLPRLSTRFWSGDMYRAITRLGPDVQEKKLVSGEQLDTRYRTPWIVDAGYELRAGNAVWAFRLGYASAVAGYDRMALTAEDDLNQGVLVPTDGGIRRIRSGNVPVLNAGVGAQFRISEVAALLAGFRTDHNFLDRSVLEDATDISGTFSYWDLYHASFGVDLHSQRVKLTVGVVYSFGRDTSSPEDFRPVGDFVQLDRELRLRTSYNQLGMTFGFSYFVLGQAEDRAAPSEP